MAICQISRIFSSVSQDALSSGGNLSVTRFQAFLMRMSETVEYDTLYLTAAALAVIPFTISNHISLTISSLRLAFMAWCRLLVPLGVKSQYDSILPICFLDTQVIWLGEMQRLPSAVQPLQTLAPWFLPGGGSPCTIKQM